MIDKVSSHISQFPISLLIFRLRCINLEYTSQFSLSFQKTLFQFYGFSFLVYKYKNVKEKSKTDEEKKSQSITYYLIIILNRSTTSII